MNNTEFYDRLGVSKDASQDEIKKAYRKMSKKYHPDINKEPGAEEKYKEVQEAYETLGDEQKRAAYDQYGPAGATVASVVELAVLMELASVDLKISSQASLAEAAECVIQTHLVKEMTFNTVLI